MIIKYFRLLSLGLTCVFFVACATKKNITTSSQNDFREVLLDTLFVSDIDAQVDTVPKVYKATAKNEFDLLHTKLNIHFNWDKQQVFGEATLTLTPYFYPLNEVELDAENFEIHTIQLQSSGEKLNYEYDGKRIRVLLDKTYKRSEKIILFISYTASPEESLDEHGEAITSDKGLFFINPTGKEKGKPQQIWTQGETENNKKWFPTFDKPNERCSQEIFITVENKFKTLSNGKLISSTRNQDGTRTDYWSQVLPHAPYLFMVAVGEFHEELDTWNQVPLHYIVEKGFAKSAKKIFNHTPEMLTFFSEKLQYPYPWDKYAQIVVRDFVSGAMENTGAVIFSDQFQKTERELIDNDNDYIVAHEIMHHWFGNLVTCEEWSNLTLNEGFANYAEYLWFEHKYGRERADYHRLTEMNGYFSQAYSQGAHPLVYYYYGNKDDMFDAHSYNKGGLVLHMLRNYVGDDAFFSALNKYLKENAFTSVEVDELRIAFEDTIGEDLNWFFNQWFLEAGHPTFDVQYNYNAPEKLMVVSAKQTQDSLTFPSVFIMPLNIVTYMPDGNVLTHSFLMNQRQQDFIIQNVDVKPLATVFDGKNDILGLINEDKTEEEYIAIYKSSKLFGDKVIALSNIIDKSAIMNDLFNEAFYFLRAMAIEAITEQNYDEYAIKLQDIVLFDPHSEVRATALHIMLTFGEDELSTILKRIVESEKAYPVLGLAFEGLAYYDIASAEKYAEQNINDTSPYIVNSLMTVFSTSKNEKYLDYFHEILPEISTFQLFDYFENYQTFLMGQTLDTWTKAKSFLQKIGMDPYEDQYKKFFSLNVLIKIKNWAKEGSKPGHKDFIKDIDETIQLMKESEPDPYLKQRYSEIENH
ncbi:MAG: M1 family metallopeptidase [Saprospiraceae bacterium]